MTGAVVLGEQASEALRRWIGISQGVAQCRKIGAELADRAAAAESYGRAAVVELECVLLGLKHMEREAAQGTLFK